MSQTATRWWWVRHAPVVGHDGKIYGRSDVECDTSDETAFDALADMLPSDALWVTSNLKRTIHTAEAILAAGDLTPRHRLADPDLAEQSFGDWQGKKSWDELIADDDPECRAFWKDPANTRTPGGESFADQMVRCGAAIARLLDEHAGGDIVAVTHGGTIRAAIAIALNAPPEQVMNFRFANLSVTRLTHFEGDPIATWRIDAVNIPPHHAVRA